MRPMASVATKIAKPKKDNIMKKHSHDNRPSLRSAIAAAAAGTALIVAGGTATAEEASLTLDYECPLPLIGNQIITANITAEIPAEQPVGDTEQFAITAINVLPADVRAGLAVGRATTIAGVAIASSTVELVGGDQELDVALDIPETAVPEGEGDFELTALGNAPSITLTESDVGQGVIRVEDLFLDIITREEDGSIAIQPIGEFTSQCQQLPGQDNVLHTFTVPGPIDDDPKISVNPDTIDFGTVQAGLTEEASISISNTGAMELGIHNITLAGNDPDAFMLSHDCTSLTNGQSCTVAVVYYPEGDQPQNAHVIIESGDPETPVKEVPLSGQPVAVVLPEIAVDPDAINFGIVEPGSSTQETVTISNAGGQDLVIEGIAIDGEHAGDFTQTSDCTTLAEDASCNVTVTYQSSIDEDRNAVLIITSNANEEAVKEIPLSTQESGGSTGIVDVVQSIVGETFIASSGGILPLEGHIEAAFELSSQTFEGDLHLEPTAGSFAVSDFFLFRGIKATAKVAFEQVEETTGAIVDDKLTATSVVNVQVKQVDLGLFGLGFKIGGGEDCRTMDPVTIELNSPAGETFEALAGGNLEGTYDLPPLENCGIFTDTLNDFMSGPGNTIELTLTAEFD
ncbi:MAG: choice-of-anchor D domain-containing protein [Halomonadaceae bacterium]|nr:MAG: choice-of-anchor D domain-containing protein [Halomonadaceae bacterium]